MMLDSWTLGSTALPIAHYLPLLPASILGLAAVHDLAVRTVPNWMPVAILPLGILARVLDQSVLLGLIVSFAIFSVSAICWRRGWMGGGDVKLLGAASLAVAPVHCQTFIAAVAIIGAFLAVIYMAAGRLIKVSPKGRPKTLFARVIRTELWRVTRGGPLPYACAIAAGFLLVTF